MSSAQGFVAAEQLPARDEMGHVSNKWGRMQPLALPSLSCSWNSRPEHGQRCTVSLARSWALALTCPF
jgi:hypothetical protein